MNNQKKELREVLSLFNSSNSKFQNYLTKCFHREAPVKYILAFQNLSYLAGLFICLDIYS